MRVPTLLCSGVPLCNRGIGLKMVDAGAQTGIDDEAEQDRDDKHHHIGLQKAQNNFSHFVNTDTFPLGR